MSTDRPFIFLNAAMTADGKLAPANRRFVPFSSRRDQQLLLELRTNADAVMAGARTVDLGKVDLGPGAARFQQLRVEQGRAQFNLRVVVSGAGSLDPNAYIFSQRFSPIIVLTTGRIPAGKLEALRRRADEVKICGESELDFPEAMRWLKQRWKIQCLVCEGGGQINEALFRYGLVDEVYLTISPLVFGGRDAPTLADGIGVGQLAGATRLELKSFRRYRDELFLVYRVLA